VHLSLVLFSMSLIADLKKILNLLNVYIKRKFINNNFVYKATSLILYVFVFAIVLSSCSTAKYKQVAYFNDLKDSTVVTEDIKNYNPLTIQKDDILAINVTSLNSEASAIFNVGNTSSNQASGSSALNNGFLVDHKGEVQLPLVGPIKVIGLTTTEAREIIRNRLLEYLKEPVVSLRLANFKIALIGDVARPGVYPINSERISIIDALGLAGDLNITAIRKNILLVREVNGERKFIRLDLNSKELFTSPYYYLQNNDALYVQPGDVKYASVDTRYRNISIGLSVVSILFVILSRF
jgi:polysaccharide export outer membrane protein